LEYQFPRLAEALDFDDERLGPGRRDWVGMFPIIQHPFSIVATSDEISRGAAILAGSHVGQEHESWRSASLVGAVRSTMTAQCTSCQSCPSVFWGGLVQIGECSAIGVDVSVSDRISMGSHAVVGTDAVIVRDIPDLVVAYGNAARVQRSRRDAKKYLD
jgi:acetyltransferase-like isoleucine patch superfamily enzyme